jgi:hypothetical protein
MNKIQLLPLLVLFSFTSSAFADSIDREKWKKEFGSEVRDIVCKSDTYFRRCFTVNQAECEGQASKSFAECFARNKAKIPASLNEAAFKEWTPKLKACVGTEMAIAFDDAKRTLESEACDPKKDMDLKVPADIYLEQAAASLPRDLCIEGMPHRSCYAVTEKECQAVMTKAAHDCIPSLQKEFPSKVQLRDSALWIMDVASCASPRYAQALSAKRTKTDEYCRTAFVRKKK